MSNKSDEQSPFVEPLIWEARVTLLDNPVVIREYIKFTAITTGVVLLIVLVIALLAEAEPAFIPRILGIVALVSVGLWLIGFLATLLVNAGGQRTRFTLDDLGVRAEVTDRRNRWINRLTVLLGALRANPTAAGAGALALAGERNGMQWKDVRVVERFDKRRTMLLKGRLGRKLLLVTPPEQWQRVVEAVERNTQ